MMKMSELQTEAKTLELVLAGEDLVNPKYHFDRRWVELGFSAEDSRGLRSATFYLECKSNKFFVSVAIEGEGLDGIVYSKSTEFCAYDADNQENIESSDDFDSLITVAQCWLRCMCLPKYFRDMILSIDGGGDNLSLERLWR